MTDDDVLADAVAIGCVSGTAAPAGAGTEPGVGIVPSGAEVANSCAVTSVSTPATAIPTAMLCFAFMLSSSKDR